MEPILFPFTYLSDTQWTAIDGCFKQIAVYQPSGLRVPAAMTDLRQAGRLSIRFPVKHDEKKLASLLEQFRSWAELHQGSERAAIWRLADAVPFFDQTNPSRIRAEIQRQDRAGTPAQQTDPMLQVSVFLQMAQAFDRQNAELHLDLQQVTLRQQALFEDLNGEDDPSISGRASGLPQVPEDPGTTMTAERMAAWARLMLCDPEPSGIFVTTSPAIVDYIKEKIPGLEKALSCDLMPFVQASAGQKDHRRQSLMNTLTALAGGTPASDLPEAGAAGDAGPTLSIHVARTTAPDDFFSRFVATPQTGEDIDGSADPYPNTVICLLDLTPNLKIY